MLPLGTSCCSGIIQRLHRRFDSVLKAPNRPPKKLFHEGSLAVLTLVDEPQAHAAGQNLNDRSVEFACSTAAARTDVPGTATANLRASDRNPDPKICTLAAPIRCSDANNVGQALPSVFRNYDTSAILHPQAARRSWTASHFSKSLSEHARNTAQVPALKSAPSVLYRTRKGSLQACPFLTGNLWKSCGRS